MGGAIKLIYGGISFNKTVTQTSSSFHTASQKAPRPQNSWKKVQLFVEFEVNPSKKRWATAAYNTRHLKQKG